MKMFSFILYSPFFLLSLDLKICFLLVKPTHQRMYMHVCKHLFGSRIIMKQTPLPPLNLNKHYQYCWSPSIHLISVKNDNFKPKREKNLKKNIPPSFHFLYYLIYNFERKLNFWLSFYFNLIYQKNTDKKLYKRKFSKSYFMSNSFLRK